MKSMRLYTAPTSNLTVRADWQPAEEITMCEYVEVPKNWVEQC